MTGLCSWLGGSCFPLTVRSHQVFIARVEAWGGHFSWNTKSRHCLALWNVFHPPATKDLHGAVHNVVF